MDIKKALRIKELRTGKLVCTFRKVAEIIEKEFPQDPNLSGNQFHGEELVKEAMETLYSEPFEDIEDTVKDEWYL